MAQADLSVANQSFPAFRSDLNNQLLALGTQQSGATAPSTTYPYMLWADTGTALLKIRNAANSAWITLHGLDGGVYYTANITQGVDTSALTLEGGATGGASIELYGLSHATQANNAYYNATQHTFRSAGGTTRFGIFESGSLTVGAADTSTTSINIGAGATGNRYSILDLVGDTTYTDYGLRLVRNNTGVNTTSALLHRGTGQLLLAAEDAGSVSIGTNGSNRVVVDSTGLAAFSNGVSGAVTRSTAVNPSGVTSVSFTSIPSWVKRVTVMFSGVSTNGTSPVIVQLGDSGGIEDTGYACAIAFTGPTTGSGTGSTAGFPFANNAAASVLAGHLIATLVGSNDWVYSSTAARTNDGYVFTAGGTKSLSATLDRIRITTVNGTDAFDAGSINILYEG